MDPVKTVHKLDKEETQRLELEMTRDITRLIVSYPRSAESAAAALSALIYCAYQLAKRMWGVDEAIKVIRFTVDHEAQQDSKGN